MRALGQRVFVVAERIIKRFLIGVMQATAETKFVGERTRAR